MPDDVRDHTSKHIWTNRNWVEKWITFAEQVLNCWPEHLLPLKAPSQRFDETKRYSDTPNAGCRELYFHFRVRNAHDPLNLLLNVSKRWLAICHLVKDTAQTPDITRLAELDILDSSGTRMAHE